MFPGTTGAFHPELRPLTQDVAFELCEATEDGSQQLAMWRSQIELFGQADEANSRLIKRFVDGGEIHHTARQPVEFPYHHGIECSRRLRRVLEEPGQRWSLCIRPAPTLVDVGLCDRPPPSPRVNEERVHLILGVLVLSRYPHIECNVHAASLPQKGHPFAGLRSAYRTDLTI